jgi:hypothetical protein
MTLSAHLQQHHAAWSQDKDFQMLPRQALTENDWSEGLVWIAANQSG